MHKRLIALGVFACLALMTAAIWAQAPSGSGGTAEKTAAAPRTQTQPSSRPASRPAAAAPAALPKDCKFLKDVEYANVGGKKLLLDLYLPTAAKEAVPLVVWIHGGGWTQGSKNPCPAVFMVAEGYAVASVEYRFFQEAPFPAQIFDCKAAIRYLRANAGQYNFDPDRIGVWGASAGGHLVALLGTSGHVKELEGDEGNMDVSSRVQAVCDYFGPSDFPRYDETPPTPASAPAGGNPPATTRRAAAPPRPAGVLLREQFQKDPELAKLMSPVTHVKSDNPPFLIVHGDADAVVPLRQSILLEETLKKAGVDATLQVVKGAGHGFGDPQIPKGVAAFFDRVLKAKAAGAAVATSKPAAEGK